MDDNAFTKLAGYTDNLKVLRALLSFPLLTFTSQYFSRTRDAEAELRFVEYCRGILEYHKDEISAEENKKYDRVLLAHELSAYDRLNLWDQYISLYKRVVREGRHTSNTGEMINHASRYPIICRKKARADAGKSVEHLKRHQQSRLTADEQADRQAEMMHLFEWIQREVH